MIETINSAVVPIIVTSSLNSADLENINTISRISGISMGSVVNIMLLQFVSIHPDHRFLSNQKIYILTQVYKLLSQVRLQWQLVPKPD